MKNKLQIIITSTAILLCVASHAQHKQTDKADSLLFDMQKILDASTLGIEVLQDWHVVKGDCPTRQKYITIRVGELWASCETLPGMQARIGCQIWLQSLSLVSRGRYVMGGSKRFG